MSKLYNIHEVACILADVTGTVPCAINNNDEWLPYKCNIEEKCNINIEKRKCWEQYLKYMPEHIREG